MPSINPRTSFPAAQIINSASTGQLSTSVSNVVAVPFDQAGVKAAFLRISVSNGAAYVNWGLNTSVTAVTGGTIVTSTEALWLNTLGGVGAVAFLLTTGQSAASIGNVAVLEEGSIRVPSITGPNTSGLG